MDLIVGGAYQGKKEYVRQTYHLKEEEMGDGGTIPLEQMNAYPCLYNTHLLIKRLMSEEINPLKIAEDLSKMSVVILDEIGCGIIPMEANERRYREMVGQTGCLLADKADRVVRVCCGISTTIK